MTKTTLEMDGIILPKDIEDRYFIMKPCVDCGKYVKQDIRRKDKPCAYCGGKMVIACTYWSSIRTHNPQKKISASDRKKMGGATK